MEMLDSDNQSYRHYLTIQQSNAEIIKKERKQVLETIKGILQ
jgi:hypothetical protein